MKPDAYFPFYGKDFFDACEAFDAQTTMAYLRALWRYWSHEHCEGINDNDAELFRICHCELANWARVKGQIFNNDSRFFVKKNGKWHQKRAFEEYTEANKNYLAAVDRAAKARLANPDNNPNVRQDNGLISVSGDGLIKGGQSESESEAKSETDIRSRIMKRPTIEEILIQGAKGGLPESECRKFFDFYESKGWKVGNQPMKSWTAAVSNWMRRWLEQGGTIKTKPLVVLADVQALCKEKWGDDSRHVNWALSFYSYWNDPTRNWKRNGVPIDWKVELSKQASKWRITAPNQ